MVQSSTFRKIGILGGAFNPVHIGHLVMAETALDQFGLEQVIWLPSYRPPHKQQHLLSFGHRWAMVQCAIADHPHFVTSDLEQQGGTTSYASTTFAQLQSCHPDVQWYWIIGSDAFQQLARWRENTQLANQCVWLIAPRHHTSISELGRQVAAELAQQGVQLRWESLQMPAIAVSSTLIRQYCQTGRSVRYLVPDSVRHYISTHNLYQNDCPNLTDDPA